MVKQMFVLLFLFSSLHAVAAVEVKLQRNVVESGKDFFFETTVDIKNPYVQQEVIYTLKVFFVYNTLRGDLTAPTADNIVIKELGKAKDYKTNRFNKRYTVHERHYVFYPQRSGHLKISAIKIKGQYVHRGRRLNINKSSSAMNLQVRPVPSAFTGNLWLPAEKIKISQQWSSDLAQWKQGEAFTRTLRLQGTGLLATQLPEFHLSEIPNFRIYAGHKPVLKNKQDSKGFIGVSVQDIVFIPLQKGDYQLPEIVIPWWNVKTDKMEYAKLPATSVTIKEENISTLVTADAPQEFNPEQFIVESKVGIIWIVLSFVFGGGWLVTLLCMVRNHYLSQKIKNKALELYASHLGHCRREIKKSCLKHDTTATQTALLKWGQAVWDDAPIGLNQLATRCHEDLRAEINQLSWALYSKEKAWTGNALWEAFSSQSNGIEASDKITIVNRLEALHRLS